MPDYSNFGFEDFLQDHFFLSSYYQADESSDKFWKECINENKINRTAFFSAKSFLDELNGQKKINVSYQDTSSLWERINKTNISNLKAKHKNQKIIRLTVVTAIAASIISFIFLFPFHSNKSSIQPDDLMHYAQTNKKQIEEQTEIQLVLSKQKVININQKTADIKYQKNEIKVLEKEIPKEESSVFNQLIVPKGKRSNLTLSDGTTIYVNAGTRVIYPNEFAKEKREIYVDGEIYIEVSPDKNRPFIIKTSDLQVKVLGTKFDVMAYESEEEKQIVLVSGSVEITPKDKGKNTILKPSEKYRCSQNDESVTMVDTKKYTSWVNGMYYCESERLDILMHKISRYYGIEITCDENTKNQYCSGKMDLKDSLPDLLEGLSFSFPITVEPNDGKYHISSRLSTP